MHKSLGDEELDVVLVNCDEELDVFVVDCNEELDVVVNCGEFDIMIVDEREAATMLPLITWYGVVCFWFFSDFLKFHLSQKFLSKARTFQQTTAL